MARARLPWPTAAIISAYCLLARWPTTLTIPTAPWVRCARFSASSPEYHSRSVCDMTSLAANRSPLASLTATIRGRLVVVGRHDQQAVGAGLGGGPGALDRVSGVVAAGAGDDAGPMTHRVDDGPDEVHLLGVRRGGRLTGGAVHDQSVMALVHEVHGQCRSAFQVKRAIGIHR